jgi:Family of unknown function (DUF6236)
MRLESCLPEVKMTEQSVHLPVIGLYYPYVHFRDERWLKLAALYWPRMARIVTPGYPTHDSELVRRLSGELGFVVDVSPVTARSAVAAPFTDFIGSLGPSELARWSVTSEGPYEFDDLTPVSQVPVAASEELPSASRRMGHYAGVSQADGGRLSAVHESEVSGALRASLIAADLARPVRGEWLAMHPELAWLYKCRLTEEVARRNRLAATTDQLPAYAALAGAAMPATPADTMSALTTSAGVETAFGLLAVTAVIPADVDLIPADKIIEVRRRFGQQFDRWRQNVDGLGAALAQQLRAVEDPEILGAYLDDAVRQYSTAPVEDLRRGLTAVGIDMADQAINSRFELPPGLAAGLAAAGSASQPHIAAAAGIAAGAVAIRRAGRRRARAASLAPAAYLLSVRETLTPQTWITRVVRAMRRMAGLCGFTS